MNNIKKGQRVKVVSSPTPSDVTAKYVGREGTVQSFHYDLIMVQIDGKTSKNAFWPEELETV